MSTFSHFVFLAFCAVTSHACFYPGGPVPFNRLPCLQETPLNPFISTCGPSPTLEPIRALPPLCLPPTNGPLNVLPCPPPPPPTVIGTKCMCTKTVVKPQLYQRVIQVQKNQRFLKRTYTPVVERIPYIARPRC